MKSKKIKTELISTLKFIAVLVAIYLAVTLLFRFLPAITKYEVFVIQTDSMVPVIEVGDIVVVKEIEPEDIEIGDIVAFNVDFNNDGVDDVVVHYIAEINEYGDKLIYRSTPEVSDSLDRWTIEEEDIIGIQTSQIGVAGNIIRFAQSWFGRTVIIIDLIVFSLIYEYFFGKDKKKKKNQNIDEESNENEIEVNAETEPVKPKPLEVSETVSLLVEVENNDKLNK